MPAEGRVERRSRLIRRLSLGRTLVWLVLTPVAYVAGWLESVTFVSLLSLWALVEASFTAWRSDEDPDMEHLVEIEAKLDEVLARLDGGP